MRCHETTTKNASHRTRMTERDEEYAKERVRISFDTTVTVRKQRVRLHGNKNLLSIEDKTLKSICRNRFVDGLLRLICAQSSLPNVFRFESTVSAEPDILSATINAH